MWRYEKCDTRDDVKIAMPDEWRVDVYKVTSGDSDKKYYVQRIHQNIDQSLMDKNPKLWKIIYLCNCPEGTFRAPLGILGAIPPQDICKHALNLDAFLKEKAVKR